jgi:hypothetical protein
MNKPAANQPSADQPAAAPGPVYFDNEVIDHLLGIVLDLGADMWVMKDRMAFMEELLEKQGIAVTDELSQGRPSPELQESLKKERQDMIHRIYGRLYSRYGGDKSEDRTAPI